ncbi:fimbrial protein [Erwinia aphidicola]|uniref:fimbrial protein n=1 Tax=Erwinia TaxID=551 RepID=UPI00105B7637|nr:fimbrial protein [Erwinia aphidicola]MCP2229873.1 major type 1 subunit fimbrin (pilin) [Erwinia aphidicola]
MKKTLLTTALISVIVLPISSAMAYDGTIKFVGLISNTTCNININGRGSNTTIKFNPISENALPQKGAVANELPFTLVLDNCKNATNYVRALFESPQTDYRTGNLINNGDAANVQIQLLDKTHQPIRLGDGSQSDGASFKIIDNTATLNYFARYYATGKVTGGKVDTLVHYSLNYF